MENCQVLDSIKKMGPELQRSFNIEDLDCAEEFNKEKIKHQIETYIKLGILAPNQDGGYMIKNMCMLSQY